MGSTVGMAANVVGGAIQAIAAEQANRAMRHTFEDQMRQQAAFQRQGFQAWQPFAEQSGVETANQQMQQGQNDRLANYAQLGARSLTPNVPKQDFAHSAGDKGVNNLTGQAKSKLAGYGDWQFKQGLGSQGLAQTLGKITNFAGGEASIFPLQMYDAQHSSDTLAKIGALISSIGGGGGNFAQQFGGQPPVQGQQGMGTMGQGSGFSYDMYGGTPAISGWENGGQNIGIW